MPGYVVISGAPGAGKTTLARPLAQRLALPLLSHDAIKEALGDSLGLGDDGWSRRLGEAALDAFFAVAATVPDAILDGWWRDERPARIVALGRPIIEVFCRCDPDVLQERANDRVASGRRHRIHRDWIDPDLPGRLGEIAAGVRPLALGGPVFEVDTTSHVDVEALAARIAGAG